MPTHFIRKEREIAKNRKIEILINYIRNYIRMCYYNIYRNVTSVSSESFKSWEKDSVAKKYYFAILISRFHILLPCY